MTARSTGRPDLMPSHFRLQRVVAALEDGAVIAYPTEGVYGIGCLPSRHDAVERVIAIKQRDAAKGLILLAGRNEDLAGWTDLPEGTDLASDDESRPVTWIVPAGRLCYAALTGGRATIAVRVTRHPVAGALSRLAGEPLVSTSANLSGHPPIRRLSQLRARFAKRVDMIVPGALGSAAGPSEIRDLATGKILRGGNIHKNQ